MKPDSNSHNSVFLHVFGRPMILALISMAGLIAALVGDGLLDVVSWIALGYIVAVVAWYVWIAKQPQRKRRA
ncbi:MAG TPA: hypothetical protein PKC29_01540 [Thermodesulfobacteriota bacterium]|nr:hypothetical protein [Thermodesulfobacteriota bacterium]